MPGSLFSRRGNISGKRYTPYNVKQIPTKSIKRLSVEVARLKNMLATKLGAAFRGKKTRTQFRGNQKGYLTGGKFKRK